MSKLLVAGLGLMGGSLAAAATAVGWEVHLHHRRPGPAEEAARRGWGRITPLAEALAVCDLAVVCTPVPVVVAEVRRLAAFPGRAVITDVGSIKGPLCADLTDLARAGRYVGSHPMCGSHQSGIAAADPALYRNALTIVTPGGATPAAIAAVEGLWQSVGCRLLRMEPEAHDRAMVAASHLPHLAASAVAAQLDETAAPLASSGFRDTTRVAGACTDLWAGILVGNRTEVRRGISDLRAHLEALDAALDAGDENVVRAWLDQGKAGRGRFESQRSR